MSPTSRKRIATGALIMAIAVMLGAFGSHALKMKLNESLLEVFKTSVRYQMIHGLGLIIIALANSLYNEKAILVAYKLMFWGIIIFCLSLYSVSFKELLHMPELKYAGAIAPIGGTLLVISWLVFAYSFFRKRAT